MMLFPYGTSRKVYKTPWVTYSIITINVALYISRLVALGISGTDIRFQLAYVYGSSPTYTMLTYAFVHGHLVHLFLSMWILYLCGFDVEERMGALGFLLLYLVSVLAACILFSMKTTLGNFILIGSTGAVFGVIFAYMIMFPLSDFKAVYFFFTYWGTTKIAAMYFVVCYLLLSLFYSLLVKNTVPWNQLGGAFVGIMFGTVDVVINALEGKYRPMQKRTREVREIMGIKRLRVLDSEEEPAPSEEEIEATVTDEMERLIVQKNFSVLAEKMSEMRKKQSDFCLPAGLQRNAADLLNQSGYKDSAEWAYRNLLEHYPDAPVTTKAHFYLGEILGYVKRSYSEAIDHLQSFLHSDPPLDGYKAASQLMEQFRKYHVGDVKGKDDFKPLATEPAFQKSQEASRFGMISRGDEDEKNENDEEDTSPDERRKEDTAPPFSAVLRPEEIIGEEASHGEKSLKKAEEEKEGIHTTPEKRDIRYTVILSPTRRCSANALIEALSDIFELRKADALARLHVGKGLLARHIESRVAQLLKKRCENSGQSVELIEENKALEFPEPLEIVSLEVTSNALELFTTKEKYYISLRNLVLISAGSVKIAPGIKGTKRVLDLFVRTPRYLMRIWDATFNYKASHLFEAEGSDFNFYRLVKKISMNAPFARESFTVKKMVNEQRCYPLEFNTVKEFENYNIWILLAYLRWDLE